MSDTNKSFDDWYAEESPFKGNENNEDCKWASKFMRQAYEAGQQSRQAEIDNLQKRVKELELINFDSELHFDTAKEEIVRLKASLETLLKSYKAQSGLPMSDEFNRGWVSAFACVHNDLKNLIK